MARAMPGLMKIAEMLSLTPTVGDVMRHISADHALSPWYQHELKQEIVNTGLPVTQPSGRLANIGVGALGGNMLARYLGGNSFTRAMATVAGGLYGNMKYNQANPDPHHRFGNNVYTY